MHRIARPTDLLRAVLTTAAALLALLPALAGGQDLQAPPPPGDLPDLPLHDRLWQVEKQVKASTLPPAAAAAELAGPGLKVREDGAVMVAIVGPPGAAAVASSLIEDVGGELRRTWRHRSSAWVPPARLSELAASLPEGYLLQPADLPHPDDEGPAEVGSDQYIAGGADGSGKTIAVIDAGYFRLTAARMNGDAPPTASTTFINYTSTAFEDTNDGRHGTGCVEAAYDHCPGATWRLYKIGNLTDAANAVDNAVANGVDVITQSISWYNKGWDDDTGDACALAQEAADNGILFFTSAGNRAQTHHLASFSDGDGDDWHNFAGGDETINITEPPNASTTFYLQWDTDSGINNFDLYLYDSSNNVIGSSTSNGNTYEKIDWSTSSSSSQTVHLAVFRAGGGGSTTTFEIFEHKAGNWQEHETAEASTTSPSNTSDPNVISVAAVDWSDFSQPSGTTGIIQGYSSRGPSNGGLTVPDISGPTNTTTTSYSGSFGGTSCATPNAAGAATAFWSSDPDLGANGVRYLLLEQAQIFRDWGADGDDTTYGRGGVQLHDHAPNTSWLDRRVGNVEGFPTLPYFYVGQAVLATPSGGRLVFVGQAYPEPINGLDKALRLESIGWSAVLGGTNAAEAREAGS